MEYRVIETVTGNPAVIVILILIVLVTVYLLDVATGSGVVKFIVCGLGSLTNSLGVSLAMCSGIPV